VCTRQAARVAIYNYLLNISENYLIDTFSLISLKGSSAHLVLVFEKIKIKIVPVGLQIQLFKADDYFSSALLMVAGWPYCTTNPFLQDLYYNNI